MNAYAFLILAIIGIASANTLVRPADEVMAQPRVGERLVTGRIVAAIREAQDKIREAGLDPLIVTDIDYQNTMIPLFLDAQAFLQGFQLVGLSDIAIKKMDFSTVRQRLTFHVVLPEVYFSVGNSRASLLIFGSAAETSLRGSVSVQDISIEGNVRVAVGVISGISIRSLDLDFSIARILSDLSIKFLGCDLSNTVNTALGVDIPDYLVKNKKILNDMLESKVLEILEENM